MIDMSTVKTVHFVGIGGISNSAIAELMAQAGYTVTGSDLCESDLTRHLRDKGIEVFIGHAAENVSNADLVVYTVAVGEENPEMAEAKKKGIPCLTRAEMLGQIMAGYETAIAISGTHGKTTTTSMVTRIFNDSKYNPTALVGGVFDDIHSNLKIGDSRFFITEACEYKESFLSFFPKIGVILNIDEDHLDYYRDLDHIVSAFVKFAKNVENGGTLIINGDDYNTRKIIPYYRGKLVTFGMADHCDFRAANIVYNTNGCAQFDVFDKDHLLCSIELQIPGQHNIYNALAAFSAGSIAGVPAKELAAKLETFKNAHRRFEKRGVKNGVTVIDDYAHHPNEIRVTLEAAKRIASVGKIWCVFQPHTYSRTKDLLHGFAGAFGNADEVLLADIYAAREKDTGEISSIDLMNALNTEGVHSVYFESFNAIVSHLKAHAAPGDLVITMGAGDIYRVGNLFLED
ncbi:MAG: UDP-N-acetylmuramate--alanine ligase [Clostridiales bacterium]|jgi:UDP-N-acetylmuramate--alanine ligase|nr:UDP-N-acetylmuramate--alanine ligase [Clostridiales bacterium]